MRSKYVLIAPSVFTVAWYTTDSLRQWPDKRNSSGFLQLHSLEFSLAGMSRESFLVVCVNVLFDITHAAITDFDYISVEDFVQYMAFREFFVYDLKESFADIHRNTFAEWRVVPNDVSVALSSQVCGF